LCSCQQAHPVTLTCFPATRATRQGRPSRRTSPHTSREKATRSGVARDVAANAESLPSSCTLAIISPRTGDQMMLADLYIDSVLAKCEALKKGGIWAPEPHLRPAAWLANFKDPQERLLAAILLDNFIFYSRSVENWMKDMDRDHHL
jgi:hypothetical protein